MFCNFLSLASAGYTFLGDSFLRQIKGHSSSIGLDIRLNEIRFIHVTYIKSSPRIEAIECIELPREAIVEGRIKLIEPIKQSLRALVQKTHTNNFPACMVLPVQSVISKKFQSSRQLTNKEKTLLIEEQLAKLFPSFSHELCYDYNILSKPNDSHENVLLVATRQQQLNDYIHIAECAGLAVKIIDIDTYALARAAQWVMKNTIHLFPIAILHIELAAALLIVVVDNEVVFHSYWNDTVGEEIYIQLCKGIQSFRTTHLHLQLNNLYILGEVEPLTEIFHRIQNTFNIQITVLPQLHSIKINSTISNETIKKFLPKMMICVGLTLRRMQKW